MAGSVNKVILLGNLGRDPEVRTTSSDVRVVSWPMAMSESWKTRDGERKERTEWARVVCFNEALGRIAEAYLKKGSKVYIEGQMQTRKWEKDGHTNYTTEIVIPRFNGVLTLLDSRQDSGGGETEPEAPAQRADLDDEIPFITRWGVR